jgi:hypothetical protein
MLPPSLPPLPFQPSLAFATLRLAEGNPSLLTVRHEKPLPPDITQNPLALDLLAKAFKQFLL